MSPPWAAFIMAKFSRAGEIGEGCFRTFSKSGHLFLRAVVLAGETKRSYSGLSGFSGLSLHAGELHAFVFLQSFT